MRILNDKLHSSVGYDVSGVDSVQWDPTANQQYIITRNEQVPCVLIECFCVPLLISDGNSNTVKEKFYTAVLTCTIK